MRWDPSFFRKNPLFWPIARAAATLENLDTWPEPSQLARAFEGAPPVRFELAPSKPRRGRAPVTSRYDMRIAVEGVVPTRARSWHDLMSALVWATFPRAKLALHRRQHAMISARLGPDLRLPGARTKEQDAVAMIDEGGVVVLQAGAETRAIIFGHAIYEGLACAGPPNVRAAAHVVTLAALPAGTRPLLAAADAALEALLTRAAPVDRTDLETIVIDDRLVPPDATSLPAFQTT